MNPAFIENHDLYLRPVEVADAPLLAACNNDPEVRETFFTHTPTSVGHQQERIKSFYSAGSDYLPFVICLKNEHPSFLAGTAIGITALHRVDLVSRAAVYSICIAESAARGNGFAKGVTNMMLAYAFETLNLHRIQLHVWACNERAVQTYKNCGFVLEGTLREAMKHQGKFCDFHVMGLLEPEWRARQ
ncbi:MAG: GNAT family N-acetyltransferase [Sumerlaeia bacterium]